MKKILAAALAILTISSVALVSCKKEQQPSNDGGNSGGDDIVFENPSNKNTDTDDNTESGTDTENKKPATKEFRDITETPMWVMSKVNLRNEANLNASSKVATADAGTAVTAIATNDTWYKIKYDNREYYVIADYLTSKIEDTKFNAVAEDDPVKTLTIGVGPDGKSYTVNIREVPSTYEDVAIVTLDNTKVTADKPLKILEKNVSGNWYKVEYEGKEYYLKITDDTKKCFNELKGEGGGSAGG